MGRKLTASDVSALRACDADLAMMAPRRFTPCASFLFSRVDVRALRKAIELAIGNQKPARKAKR